MICLIQRVTEAHVVVENEVIGKIAKGMLILAAVERADTIADAAWIANKIATLRIFPNNEKDFDADLTQIAGEILLVSNFTLAAATRKGRRPSFDLAADPIVAEPIFNALLSAIRAQNIPVQTGRFGADMKIHLTNDGPATFIIRTDERKLNHR
jgi:D-tyrosyl-tRNA(Tyr) deacylase